MFLRGQGGPQPQGRSSSILGGLTFLMACDGAPGLGPEAAARSIGKRNSGCPSPVQLRLLACCCDTRACVAKVSVGPHSLPPPRPPFSHERAHRAVQWLGRWGELGSFIYCIPFFSGFSCLSWEMQTSTPAFSGAQMEPGVLESAQSG